MKERLSCRKAIVSCLVAVGTSFAVYAGITGTWTGLSPNNADGIGKWSDPDNWERGVIPGRCQGSGEWNDEAVFTTCTGATIVDLSDLQSIARITVTGSDAPKFIFGTSTSQKLPLEALTTNDGNWISVDATAGNAPEFVACVEFGWHEFVGGTKDSNTYVRNYSARTLKFSQIGESGWIDKKDGGSAPSRSLYWQGTGPIEVSGAWTVGNAYYTDLYTLYFDNPGGVVFTGAIQLSGEIKTSAPNNRIVVAEGATLTVSKCVNPAANVNSRIRFNVGKTPFTIDGAGTLLLQPTDLSQFTGGGLVAINCKIGFMDVARAETTGWTFYSSCNLTLTRNGGSLAGPFYWYDMDSTSDHALILPKIGRVGESSPLGDATPIVFGNGGQINFTGDEPDETDRALEIGPVATYVNNGNSARVNQNGSATLTVDSPFLLKANPADGLHKLVLGGSGTADGIWKHALDDGEGRKLQVKKTGAVRWVFDGANSYSGKTIVEQGVLALGVNGSLSESEEVTLADNAAFEIVAGTKSVKVLTAAGIGTLKVDAGATLNVGLFKETGGRLKVELGEGAILISEALKGTVAPAWISIMNMRLCFDAEGRAFAGSGLTLTDEISARGGIIPNNKPSAIVGITTEGTTGPITIADGADATIDTLIHRTAIEASVDLGGKKLTMSRSFIESNGTTLTFANGTVKAGAEGLEFTPIMPGMVFSIAAGLDLNGETLVKKGSGTVDLAGPIADEVSMDIQGGTVVRTDGGMTISPNRVLVGTALDETARFAVSNATVTMSTTPVPVPAKVTAKGTVNAYPLSASIILGHGGDGVMEVSKDAAVESSITIGSCAGSDQGAGALFVDGSFTACPLPVGAGRDQVLFMPYYIDAERDAIIGGWAFCRVGEDAAFVNQNSYLWMSQQERSAAVFEQRGGTVNLSSLWMGRCPNAAAHYYMTAGKCAVGTDLILPAQYYTAYGSHLIVTLDGDCEFAVADAGNRVTVGVGSKKDDPTDYGTEEIFNICNGGRLAVGGFTKYNTYNILPQSAKTFINFDGGTMYCKLTSSELFGAPGADDWRVDRVTTYGRGATIEIASGRTTVANVAISGPTGRGVASVVWEGTSAEGRSYIGAPMVVIRDRAGKGRGATAAALFDRTTGKVTGIKVVSSGFDYEDPIAEIRADVLNGTEGCSWFTNACVLTGTDRVSGGLVKTGAGTLKIAKACTYTGDTVLKEGTLTLVGVEASLASAVVPAGGLMTVEDGAVLPSLWKFTATADPITYAGDLPNEDCTIRIDVAGAPWKSRTLATFTGAVNVNNVNFEIVGGGESAGLVCEVRHDIWRQDDSAPEIQSWNDAFG